MKLVFSKDWRGYYLNGPLQPLWRDRLYIDMKTKILNHMNGEKNV